jgi:DNA-binding transcriptional MerR regulator
MLKVGELAALANLTVRTLHHYDSIGLLQPSARSDAGYRLYDRDDVARLHQIQALRAFGMSLSDIGLYLDSPEGAAGPGRAPAGRARPQDAGGGTHARAAAAPAH